MPRCRITRPYHYDSSSVLDHASDTPMKISCTVCGVAIEPADLVLVTSNAPSGDGQTVCRDCVYNPAPELGHAGDGTAAP